MKRKASSTSNAGKVRRLDSAVDIATSRAISRTVKKEVAKTADYKQLEGLWVPVLGASSSGVVFGLSTLLSRGDAAVNNFEGHSIDPKSLKVRWISYPGTDSHNSMRLMIVQWFDDAIPGNAGAFLTGSYIGTVDAPLATRLHTNRPLMKILWDYRYVLNNDTGDPGSDGPFHVPEVYIPGKRLRRMFFNSTGTRCQKGEIYLVAISDSTVLDHPGVKASVEMIFTD